jgi:single-stranded-DNA-specific exonuclease
MKFFVESNLDLVALGTIADIMPLLDENRILVKQGLLCLNKTQRPGVKVLLERCLGSRDKAELTAKYVSWNITPLLNAAGRRSKSDLTVKLLLSENLYDAQRLLDGILDLNEERKKLQSKYVDKFMSLAEHQCDLENDKILVVEARGLEHGITGIIASQIVRKYYKPAILLISDEKEAVGAARSIEGFDMVDALNDVKDILVKYGGHPYAAGLTVETSNIEEFKNRIKKTAQERISGEKLVQNIEIDAELEMDDINSKLLNELKMIEPFGSGNPYPVFSLREVKVLNVNCVGAKNHHLKLNVAKNGKKGIDALGWSMGNLSCGINKSLPVDLAVHVEANVWNGKRTLQLTIIDIKPVCV